MPLMRDGSYVRDPRLGRLPQYDLRNRRFLYRDAAADDVPVFTKVWDLPQENLDQGNEGTCVGHGFTQEGAALPVPVSGCDHTFALGWFDAAALRDPWPGEDRNNGTSVLAGAQVGKEWGFFGEYRWCDHVYEVMHAIATEGPVVLGIDWLENMFEPDSRGLLNVTGPVAGGHCLLARGIILAADNGFGFDVIQLSNSWGEGWGVGGDAFIRTEDLAHLMDQGGEACVPMNRADPNDAPIDPDDPDPVKPAPDPVPERDWFDKLIDWILNLFK